MRFTSLINNVRAVEWELTINEAYLFAWFYELPAWADKVVIEGKDYYFASRYKAIEELPLLTDKPDTMYRYYKALEDKGLVVFKKVDGKDYLQLTETAKKWNESEGSENFPKKLGKKSGKQPEKNPTYKSISKDKITSDTIPAEPVADKPMTLYQKFIDVYWEWGKRYAGVPPKVDGVAGKAAKAIINYLRTIVKDKAKTEGHIEEETWYDEKVIESWKMILANWTLIEPYLQQKTTLVDINSKIQDIVNQVRNGKKGQPKASNGHSKTAGLDEAIGIALREADAGANTRV